MLGFIINSQKKTKAMNECASLWINYIRQGTYWIYHQELDEAYQNLFNIMKKMGGFKEIIEKHNITSDKMLDVSSRMVELGYGNGLYKNGDFLPVGLVSFGETLDFIFENWERLENSSNDEFCDIIEAAISHIK